MLSKFVQNPADCKLGVIPRLREDETANAGACRRNILGRIIHEKIHLTNAPKRFRFGLVVRRQPIVRARTGHKMEMPNPPSEVSEDPRRGGSDAAQGPRGEHMMSKGLGAGFDRPGKAESGPKKPDNRPGARAALPGVGWSEAVDKQLGIPTAPEAMLL